VQKLFAKVFNLAHYPHRFSAFFFSIPIIRVREKARAFFKAAFVPGVY
jgi:hypothetical protein